MTMTIAFRPLANKGVKLTGLRPAATPRSFGGLSQGAIGHER